jgi:hypothetical protein
MELHDAEPQIGEALPEARPANRCWSPVLGVESAGLALQVAREVASRFRDRERRRLTCNRMFRHPPAIPPGPTAKARRGDSPG